MAYYKAVLVENTLNDHNGKWAVGKGSKYFLTTVAETKAEAEKEALIWNMQEAYEKAQEFYQKGVDAGHFEEDSFGDYIC